MTHIKNILASLRTQPSYTLMRGVARFAAIRRLTSLTRSLLHRSKARNFIAECESRMGETLFPDLDRHDFVRRLKDDGVAFGLRLPDSLVKEIQEFADQENCYADRNPAHGYPLSKSADAEALLGKPILVAQYYNVVKDCPAVAGLLRDPVLQWIACQYLESAPTFVGANLWWTFPVNPLKEDKDRHAHLFHRDVDDFRFFKFFFYITDVGNGDGAHICVRASNHFPPKIRPGDRWNIRRYSDTEISNYYRQPDILEITGSAGTGFAEDTLCVHKGLTPTAKKRLLLQFQFALFDHGVMHDRCAVDMLSSIA